jgi:hypothetical protein
MINLITFTGADDSVKPQELLDISAGAPFVEWGILVSQKKIGTPRYPTADWMQRLEETVEGVAVPIHLSMHLCGSMCKNIVLGIPDSWQELPTLINKCNRLQLNFKANSQTNIDYEGMIKNLANIPVDEIILPFSPLNVLIATAARSSGINMAVLYDDSGGRGIIPVDWPAPLTGVHTGYAGGLGPDNLTDHAVRINSVVKNLPSWVDMETQIRSHRDAIYGITDYFDLSKVNKCIDIMRSIV